MSGRSPPLYCTLILITMHSHQSYSSITTVIHSYEYSPTVDNSTIETYRNRGLGKKCTLVYCCIISLIVMQGRVFIQRLQIQNHFLEFKQVILITMRNP